jgi:hypothetical protein
MQPDGSYRRRKARRGNAYSAQDVLLALLTKQK